MRTLVLSVAALVVALPLAAQAGIESSIKGGVSFGDVSDKGLLPGNLKGRTGFAAGLGLATRGIVGVGIEGLFAQRGVTSATATAERKLDYLDVPAYLRVVLPTPGAQPFAYAGPQVSFELRCRAGPVDCDDGQRRKTSYAAVIGAGVRLGNSSRLTIEGRYVYGLDDLRLDTITTGDSYRTRSFVLLVGVSI